MSGVFYYLRMLIDSEPATVVRTATDAGPVNCRLTLGYKDRNFAIIPVTVKQAGGDSTQVSAKAGDNFEDALSVLGQFEVNAKAANTGVSLGKFFATGVAAQKLSDGFASKLGKERDTE